MKKLITPIAILSFFFSSCTKDKFECGVEANTPPADDSSVLFIPTAFSPDGNGCNDVFWPYALNIESIHTEVYDTENKLLFETYELNKPWLPDGFETGMTLLHYKVTAKSKQGYEYYRCGDLYSYKCLPKGFEAKKLVFGDQYDPALPGNHIRDTTICEIMESCK